ncbi:hypothetical protein MAM1_0025c02067 [Mucor ambiguus]|uniref:Uncharacterized protein n=1 Tax=Mucor ambiguus TaxID=91626 RepID=A0A0C9MHN1_9FUNG|nr:hypothetical protein MAM1_0025c02067 [Mucor ambiguus]
MSNDDLSSYTASSKNSSFEVIFSRLLDALIFTSAIAITAYSYLTGTLLDQPVSYVEAPPKPILKKMATRQIEDSKRRRTQEWAEQQLLTQNIVLTGVAPSSSSKSSKKKRSQSASHIKVQPLDLDMKRDKKRTHSLPAEPVEREDEIISQIQSLIQLGQDALSSPVNY